MTAYFSFCTVHSDAIWIILTLWTLQSFWTIWTFRIILTLQTFRIILTLQTFWITL